MNRETIMYNLIRGEASTVRTGAYDFAVAKGEDVLAGGTVFSDGSHVITSGKKYALGNFKRADVNRAVRAMLHGGQSSLG